MDRRWTTPDTDPVEDILKTIDYAQNQKHEPARVLATDRTVIWLKASELYSDWKADWRRQHKILSLLERISNKIRGIK